MLPSFFKNLFKIYDQDALLLKCPRNAEGYVQNFFAILSNMAKKFCTFLGHFSTQIIRSKILNRF